MGFYKGVPELLRVSLTDYLHIAEVALMTERPGGSYGFSAALLLFSIADAIGSYRRGDRSFTVLIDGKKRHIGRADFQHFFVLNDQWYKQRLSYKQIETIYSAFRSGLSHNATMQLGFILSRGNPDDDVFYPDPEKIVEAVNLDGLLAVSKVAVQQFLGEIDTIVAGSQQADQIYKRGEKKYPPSPEPRRRN